MITLTSRWKLKNGASPDLMKALASTVAKIRESESGTLMYLVHLAGPSPIDGNLKPIAQPVPPIPGSQQTEVVFVEIYRDAEAFSRHVSGDIFNTFRKDNLCHFYEDPTKPGWPLTVTEFLVREDGFLRSEVGK